MINYSAYAKRYGFQEPTISALVPENLDLIIVIPVHNEPNLIASLESLKECDSVQGSVEVILVINSSELASPSIREQNSKCLRETQAWVLKNTGSLPFTLHAIETLDLPDKHAGVGLARKIGMDEALYRFDQIKKENGIIACFDADSLVTKNYFQSLIKHFQENPKSDACSIHFEHPLSGELPADLYLGIAQYELHLRYYKNAIGYIGLPYDIHTIGSSMAVRARAYQEQGGMNKRKAGEDFYFLQKFIAIGSCTELTEACIMPSPRISKRVPFGTGRALLEMTEEGRDLNKSYSFELFRVLKDCFESKELWYFEDIANEHLLVFVGKDVWRIKLNEIRSQSRNQEAFEKRFFQWFNAFKLLKFVHFLRDQYFENEDLSKASARLLLAMNLPSSTDKTEGLLKVYRKLDRKELSFRKTSE